MHAAFGTLTFQRWDDAAVYAFTENSGCLYTGPVPAPRGPTPTLNRPTQCVEWTFVDAMTGAQLESTWEPVSNAAN
ncbi:MAG: hypothetical protein QOG52_2611 [Frankiaceae bacterium]|nr:hypothetical protein [Frankiaceae bacterium]